LHENRQIRRFLRELARAAEKRNQIVEANSELGQWIQWLTAYVERSDPVRQLLEGASVKTVAAESSTTKLPMGERPSAPRFANQDGPIRRGTSVDEE